MHLSKPPDLPSLVKMHFLRQKGEVYEITPPEQWSSSLVLAVPAAEAHEDRPLSETADECLMHRVSSLNSKF